MNILFLTLVGFESIQTRNLYSDLLREFVKNGHQVSVISPVEKRHKQKTHIIKEGKATILRLQIGNIQKTNIIEKGISTVLIDPIFKKAIKNYFNDVRFNLVLYSTPPITLVSTIKYVKKRDGAKTYLLLKDIFPQNAVDIGMLKTTGVKGFLYRHFRRQEKELYSISDRIGCMSQANVNYVIKNNPQVNPTIVEVCPNSIEVIDKSVDDKTRNLLREKYAIPLDKIIFVYGGNLGKPQGISFLVECLKKCRDLEDVYFLVIGDGTEYSVLENHIKAEKPKNITLMKHLPKEDYDSIVGACDVGLIFLDHRFTIPNFPSRLLSYMQAKLPILAATDTNTDIGTVIVEGGFGWWCESNSADEFRKRIEQAREADRTALGEKSYRYLLDNYSVEKEYKIIQDSLK